MFNFSMDGKEGIMFTVTEKAAGALKDFLEKQQGPRGIRILVRQG